MVNSVEDDVRFYEFLGDNGFDGGEFAPPPLKHSFSLTDALRSLSLFSEPFEAHGNISLKIKWGGRDRQRQSKLVI